MKLMKKNVLCLKNHNICLIFFLFSTFIYLTHQTYSDDTLIDLKKNLYKTNIQCKKFTYDALILTTKHVAYVVSQEQEAQLYTV